MSSWSRNTSFAEWYRYAAVNETLVSFHMDDEASRCASNEEGACGMGNLHYAYIVNALHDWIGDEGIIRKVGCQYRTINRKDDVLTVVGEMTRKKIENGQQRVHLKLNVAIGRNLGTFPHMRPSNCSLHCLLT